MKKLILVISTIVTNIVALFSPLLVKAAITTTNISTQFSELDENNVINNNIGYYINVILQVALAIAAIATLFMIIWGGVSWITAGGDKSKYEEARKRITGGLIGLALTASAWAIWILVLNIFNLEDLPYLSIGGSAQPAAAQVTTPRN